MATGLITKKAVDACKPGQEPGKEERPGKPRQYVLWDTEVKGFGLLVTTAGARSYVYQYRIGGRANPTRRYTIGKHGDPHTPEGARKLAKDLAAKVDRGIDPIDEERAERAAKSVAEEKTKAEAQRLRELKLSDYADKFIKLGLKPGTRDRTREGYESTLKNHIKPALGQKPLPEITRADIAKALDRIPLSQPAVRRITFAVLRMLFKWAIGRGDIDANPLEGIPSPQAATSRDRVLSDEELALALRAAAEIEAPFGPFYQMLFATGQRREEVAGLDWSEIDGPGQLWTLPAERAKNGEASLIPLNRPALAVLIGLAPKNDKGETKWPKRGLVFTTTGETPISGYSRAKARLDAKMLELARLDAEEAGEDPEEVELAPWRLHDARRTVATALQRLGVRFEVTEAILNHTAGASRSGVAAVYQRHGWGPEKRAALDAWAAHCDGILSPPADQSNVVPMHGATNSTA